MDFPTFGRPTMAIIGFGIFIPPDGAVYATLITVIITGTGLRRKINISNDASGNIGKSD